MPKTTKRRSIGHEQSAKSLANRQLALAERQTEHVEIGSKDGLPGNEILKSLSVETGATVKPAKKKEKHILKHELFLKRLEPQNILHSKSHERRMRRKAKEQVAGGFHEMHTAIAAVETAEITVELPVVAKPETPNKASAKGPKTMFGQIGEGKGATLTETQRKRALQTERLRMPLIHSNPQFAVNPFETIRTHAHNTLVKHKVPETPSGIA